MVDFEIGSKHKLLLCTVIVLVIVSGLYVLLSIDQENSAPSDDTLSPTDAAHIASKSDLIVVAEPVPLSIIASPLTILGDARGTWFFEGDFPISILDANGNLLGRHYATAQSEWMTEDFVPFSGALTFNAPSTATGTLVLHKDNPSDIREYDDELRIPVRFAADTPAERTVRLYHYNPERDTDQTGNIMCSADGLVAVERSIPITQTPIQDTVRLLLQGELTTGESATGITTEYPLEGVALEGAALSNGILTLAFSDPNNRTSGGACRAGILWLQIRETALQFDEVNAVRFQPEDLFQP